MAIRLRRAYRDWMEHQAEGSLTTFAAGAKTRDCRRRGEPDTTQRKMPCLGFELLQWFVDEIVSLQSRADSGLLLDKACEYRDRLLNLGALPEELPKISKGWLKRWRKTYGISYRTITCRFKVPRAAAMERIRVMLGNIFRLRALWRLVFGDRPMKWLSMDQKPSWFNNAGLKGTYTRRGAKTVTTKTDHVGIRQRYTICTFVQSWPTGDSIVPPVAVMFKGSSGAGGTIRDDLERPEWMLLQVQEKGSYRLEDVLAVLEWTLPQAHSAADSIILLLDWYSAHIDPRVQELVNRKGHILLLHGGGVTGMEQINDTHFHALVQRRMEELETVELYNQRKDNPSKVARLTRQIIIDIVRQMWLGLPHDRLAATGYSQTGPCLPEEAGAESIYHALRPFWEELMGDQLRRDATEYVENLWREGAITSWSDAQALIEDHTPHSGIHEGLEGAAWDIEESGDEGPGPGDDSSDGDSGDDGPPGGGGASASASSGPAPGGASASSGPAPGGGGDAPKGGSDGGGASGGGGGAGGDKDIAWGGICTESGFTDALGVVAGYAERTHDDDFLRQLKKRQKFSNAKKESDTSKWGAALKTAALSDRDAEAKRRAERAELERRAGLEDLQARKELEGARTKTLEARREALEASRILRQEVADRRAADANRRVDARWLQVDYPCRLAIDLQAWRASLNVEQEAALRRDVAHLARSSRPSRHADVQRLWAPVASFTRAVCTEAGPHGGRITIRSSSEFEWILYKNGWAAGSRNDASWMFLKLIDRIAPQASDLFRHRYTPQVMFDWADGVAELAFVFAMVLLSKWLGAAKFPQGVHFWPPISASSSSSSAPVPVLPSASASSSSSSAPPLPPPPLPPPPLPSPPPR